MIGGLPGGNKKPAQELVEEEILNEPLLNRINELCIKSQYSYPQERGVNCSIENNEGKLFEVKVIENSNSPEFNDVIFLLKETFGEGQKDSVEILKTAIDGKSPWGTLRDKYRIISIFDENKELSAACVGSVLNAKNSEKDSSNEMIYYVAYIATNPNLKKSGLAREAYISSLMDAAKIAKENNKNLTFSTGECTPTSEHFWNSMGEKRIYIKSNGGYKELSYILPALNFNKDTGSITPNSVETPLHLMIDSFDGEKISKEKIKIVYETIVSSEMWPREAFSNNEAYENYSQYIQNLKNKFIETLDSEGELVLLSAEEKENIQKEGFIVSENK